MLRQPVRQEVRGLRQAHHRFRRREVHLIRGSPVAPAVFHLLPVLRLTGGRWLLPKRRQDPVPRMQQQPIERGTHLCPRPPPYTLCHSILRTPGLVPQSVRQSKERNIKCCHSGLFPHGGISFALTFFNDLPNPTFTVFKGPVLLTVISPLFSASFKSLGC